MTLDFPPGNTLIRNGPIVSLVDEYLPRLLSQLAVVSA